MLLFCGETKNKAFHPHEDFYHLWYLGVEPESQNKGIGTNFLREIIESKNDRPIYLETSTLKNIPWYEKLGFEVFHELDLKAYKLFLIRRN